jgi:hypothetical protein
MKPQLMDCERNARYDSFHHEPCRTEKNIGKTFQFFPIPRHDSASGSYESDKNQWLLRRETPDKKGLEFLNILGDYNPLVLDSPKINKFDEPDVLILRGQVIFDGSTVRYEPFTPKPASLSGPSTSLRLYLEGVDENGVRELPGPTVDVFRFSVANRGATNGSGLSSSDSGSSNIHTTFLRILCGGPTHATCHLDWRAEICPL